MATPYPESIVTTTTAVSVSGSGSTGSDVTHQKEPTGTVTHEKSNGKSDGIKEKIWALVEEDCLAKQRQHDKAMEDIKSERGETIKKLKDEAKKLEDSLKKQKEEQKAALKKQREELEEKYKAAIQKARERGDKKKSFNKKLQQGNKVLMEKNVALGNKVDKLESDLAQSKEKVNKLTLDLARSKGVNNNILKGAVAQADQQQTQAWREASRQQDEARKRKNELDDSQRALKKAKGDVVALDGQLVAAVEKLSGDHENVEFCEVWARHFAETASAGLAAVGFGGNKVKADVYIYAKLRPAIRRGRGVYCDVQCAIASLFSAYNEGDCTKEMFKVLEGKYQALNLVNDSDAALVAALNAN